MVAFLTLLSDVFFPILVGEVEDLALVGARCLNMGYTKLDIMIMDVQRGCDGSIEQV
jgi:hypothetical protein